MIINWPEIIMLVCLSLPGAFVTIPRLIHFLLPKNSEELIARVSRLAIFQTLFMVFIMALAGSVLSTKTGLKAGILEGLLQGKSSWLSLQSILLPTLLSGALAFAIFALLFYGFLRKFIDESSFQTMRKLHHCLKLDGSVLYGGVIEEIIARWGLMNVMAFFAISFTGQTGTEIIWIAILTSGSLFATSQLPIYIAAGCKKSRRFIAALMLLHLWLATVFGFLFWQFGLLAGMLAHMLFHILWSLYDQQ